MRIEDFHFHLSSRKVRVLHLLDQIDFIVYLVEGSRDSCCKQKMISTDIDSDPLTYEEAIKSQDATFWKEAIDDDMNSIIGNNTWILVDLPLVPFQLVVNGFLKGN